MLLSELFDPPASPRLNEGARPTFADLLQQVHAEAKQSGTMQGQCEGFAGDLVELLARHGYRALMVHGTYEHPFTHDGRKYPRTPHTWVELEDGTILDPTREQFGSFGPDDLFLPEGDPDRRLYDAHERRELNEGAYDDDEGEMDEVTLGDWRAWIDPAGKLHVVHDEETHAEFVWGHFEHGRPKDDEAEIDWDVDVAFAKAIGQGWIRVGLNFGSMEFFTTFDAEKVTPEAIEHLLKVVETRHADAYYADPGSGHATPMALRQFTAYFTRMLVQKKVAKKVRPAP